ncbi:MAG: hypothetical protein F9K47_12560 [Burkholderiales bacterium]|nr:MAG: hypothetical protein F9K47_12560 [Burkholderiales bacterium]
MPKLPSVSGADVVRALERLGFVIARQAACFFTASLNGTLHLHAPTPPPPRRRSGISARPCHYLQSFGGEASHCNQRSNR